ncbi:MAG: efflux RND transporter permease subunit [Verrucomicrobiota bacterium]
MAARRSGGASQKRFIVDRLWWASLVSLTVSRAGQSQLWIAERPDSYRGGRRSRRLIEEVNRYALEELPGVRVAAKALENGPPVGEPIQIRIRGEDLSTLYQLRDKIASTLREVPGTTDIRDDWGAWTKQVQIDPDPVRSVRLGLGTQTIAEAVALQFDGTTATTFRDGEFTIPIVMRTREDFRDNLNRIADVPIFEAEGGAVPLSQVADVAVEFQPGSIERRDTIRTLTVLSKTEGRFASEILADVQPRLSEMTASSEWPPGYTIEYAGTVADSADAQQKMAAGMPIPMAILALILIAQFNSLRRFAIIVITLPPMLIGVVPGLILTGSTFGFMTMLGMIALLGIIVNNAILLIDETNLQLASGKGLTDATVDAARSRLRPILMTTATTIIGLMPLAITGGGMWTSMAWAMIFGLAFATVLTLLLCPALFFLFFRRTYSEEGAART